MFLLNLVPFYYRWIALALLVAAVWGHGYVKGREAGADKVDKITAQIQSERDQQAIKTGQTIIQDKEKLSNVVQDFHSNLAAVNAYWLRQPKAAPRVPAGPAIAEGAAAGCPDAIPDRSYEELEQACSVTTAMFNACREGWLSQEK